MWEGVSSLAGWGFKSLHGQSALCGKGCPAWQGGGLNHYTDKGLYVGRGVQPGRVGVGEINNLLLINNKLLI